MRDRLVPSHRGIRRGLSLVDWSYLPQVPPIPLYIVAMGPKKNNNAHSRLNAPALGKAAEVREGVAYLSRPAVRLLYICPLYRKAHLDRIHPHRP